MPENISERRECLRILEKVDWQAGLLEKLATDKEVSAVGRPPPARPGRPSS